MRAPFRAIEPLRLGVSIVARGLWDRAWARVRVTTALGAVGAWARAAAWTWAAFASASRFLAAGSSTKNW